MGRVAFTVDGLPAPKGSRVFLGKGRSRESSAKAGPWAEAVATLAMANRPAGRTLDPPYWIELHFRMPEKANPKWAWPSSDGDIDKLVRATLDGLVGGRLLLDDRHITKLYAEKEFAPLVRCGVDVLIL